MKRAYLIIPVFIASILLAVIAQGHAAEYKGRIVNADTGEAIDGAVFNMSWQQWCMPGYDKFFDSRETLTDNRGFFIIQGPPMNFSLICWTEDDPYFIAYKAGFVPIRYSMWFKPNLMKMGFLEDDKVVLKLRKAISSKEMINSTIGTIGSFPFKFQKLLVKEINKECKRLKIDTRSESDGL